MSGISVADSLSQRMQYLIARQNVVAGNIANADTPGYASRDIRVRANGQTGGLRMATTNAGHLAAQPDMSRAYVTTQDQRFIQHNGNSVRIDQEMLKMQDTQMNYRLMTQLYAKQVSLQQTALGRGR
jgi:flagellar basal-body rod protein FlgB